MQILLEETACFVFSLSDSSTWYKTQKLFYSQTEMKNILEFFIRGLEL